MISLTSDPKVIWSGITEEYSKAVYWLEKQFGGSKGIDRERDRLLELSQRTRKDACSEIFKWKSKEGNLWVAYEYCRYFPDAATSYSMPHAFCYYETIGSVGVFLPIFSAGMSSKGPIGCLVFTSHFFLRAAERLGFTYSSEECLARFISMVPQLSLVIKPADEKGVVAVDVRMPGAIGRGVRVSESPLIIQVRTCLKDTQLSYAQKRNVKPLVEYADLKQQPITDVAIAQAYLNSESSLEMYSDSRKAFEKAYGDARLFDLLSWAHCLICLYLKQLNLFDELDVRFIKQSMNVLERLDMEFMPKLVNEKRLGTILPIFSEFCRQFMSIMHIKGFDKTAYYQFMVESFTKAYNIEQNIESYEL